MTTTHTPSDPPYTAGDAIVDLGRVRTLIRDRVDRTCDQLLERVQDYLADAAPPPRWARPTVTTHTVEPLRP